MKTRNHPSRSLGTVGWREMIMLPDLSAVPIKAKVDTGARTSALHAFDLQIETVDGYDFASFTLHPQQRSASDSARVTCPVQQFRKIRSSNGKVENRPVIVTTATLGEHTWPLELTLTSRDSMGFRMLLGRSAIRSRFMVNPGRSYVQSRALKGPRS